MAQVSFFVAHLRHQKPQNGILRRRSRTLFLTCAKHQLTCAKNPLTCAKHLPTCAIYSYLRHI